jgi:hypothetical protein
MTWIRCIAVYRILRDADNDLANREACGCSFGERENFHPRLEPVINGIAHPLEDQSGIAIVEIPSGISISPIRAANDKSETCERR